MFCSCEKYPYLVKDLQHTRELTRACTPRPNTFRTQCRGIMKMPPHRRTFVRHTDAWCSFLGRRCAAGWRCGLFRSLSTHSRASFVEFQRRTCAQVFVKCKYAYLNRARTRRRSMRIHVHIIVPGRTRLKVQKQLKVCAANRGRVGVCGVGLLFLALRENALEQVCSTKRVYCTRACTTIYSIFYM